MTSHPQAPNPPRIRGLLPVAPDLVVTRRPGEPPVINQVAPWVAARLGREAHDLFGQPLSSVEHAIPGLSSLVEAALDGDGPVVSGRASGSDAPDARPAALLVATPDVSLVRNTLTVSGEKSRRARSADPWDSPLRWTPARGN